MIEKKCVFTPQELLEMAAFDAIVDMEPLTADEVAQSKRLDRIAKMDRMTNSERKKAERRRQYYECHRGDIAEYKRQYYKTHQQKVAECRQRYRKAHRAEIAERQRRYREAHLDEAAKQRRLVREMRRAENVERRRFGMEKPRDEVDMRYQLYHEARMMDAVRSNRSNDETREMYRQCRDAHQKAAEESLRMYGKTHGDKVEKYLRRYYESQRSADIKAANA